MSFSPIKVYICEESQGRFSKYEILFEAGEVLCWIKSQLECWGSDTEIDLYICDINQNMDDEDSLKDWEDVDEFDKFLGELQDQELWEIMEKHVGKEKPMRYDERLSNIWTTLKKSLKKRPDVPQNTKKSLEGRKVWICSLCSFASLKKLECDCDNTKVVEI